MEEGFPKGSGIYLITDRHVVPEDDFLNRVENSAKAGVLAIQLREKDLDDVGYLDLASKVLMRIKSYKTPLILNRRYHLIDQIQADGVQIGFAERLLIQEIRRQTERPIIVGVSVHSLEEVAEAHVEGADFVTLSPVFPTKSKPSAQFFIDLSDIALLQSKVSIPIYPLGGIDESNVQKLQDAGIKRMACIRAVLEAKNIQDRVKNLHHSVLG
jgi:thiamine-phosphate pyrophosphorylase